MKNPLANLWNCGITWLALRRHRGLFSLKDASLQLSRVVLPGRMLTRQAERGLDQEVEFETVSDGRFEVRLRHHDLRFLWPERPSANLYFLVEQEIDPRNPHCYTTPPIQTQASSLVLDVGACEGLFAFRVLKQGLARRVICFEPVERMAALIGLGAKANRIEESVTVERMAVDERSGRVGLNLAEDVQTNRMGSLSQTTVESTSLDDYCEKHRIQLTSRDLIKIDAEGHDFRVLRGAERILRAGSPQIAVTTYHEADHAGSMIHWLKTIQPAYRMRLKGFSFWTDRPRPVLLQAAL